MFDVPFRMKPNIRSAMNYATTNRFFVNENGAGNINEKHFPPNGFIEREQH